MTGTDPVTSGPDSEKRIEPPIRPLSLRDRVVCLAQAGQAKVTSLPGGQRWVLWRIEKSILASDLHLESQFTIFWRSTRLEAMPLSERIPPEHWQRRAVVLATAGLAIAAARFHVRPLRSHILRH